MLETLHPVSEDTASGDVVSQLSPTYNKRADVDSCRRNRGGVQINFSDMHVLNHGFCVRNTTGAPYNTIEPLYQL